MPDLANENCHSARIVTPRTVLDFLVGRQDAIIALVTCRSTVWMGLLFVVSAGFAREYDGESLLHEPWHMLIPLGASLVTSFMLFALLALVARLGRSFHGPFFSGYRLFLGVYWMTAPLAWLYAIPVEQFVSPANAVRINLFLLAVVSCWRVALMTRIVSVLCSCRIISALILVMFFADAVALSILYLTPMPVFDLMGGIRLTESEQIIQSTHFLVGCSGTVTAPIWLIGGLILLLQSANKKSTCQWRVESTGNVRIDMRLWIFGSAAILIWSAVLPFSQPQQYNRWQVRHALERGRIGDAMRYMAERERDDFPRHWDPPPRIGYGQRDPELADILDHLTAFDIKGWVRQIYLDKLRFQAENSYSRYFRESLDIEKMSDDRLSRYVQLLESSDGGEAIAHGHSNDLDRWFETYSADDEHTSTERDQQLLRLKTMSDRYEARRKEKR